MKEKVEELIDKKIEELLNKDNLALDELAFLISQLERKELKKFQEEHKQIMASLIETM